MIEHVQRSADGCSVTVVVRHPGGGSAMSTMTWPDAATAEKYLDAGVRAMGDSLLRDITDVNEHERIRLWTTRRAVWGLARLSGPPTWWLPRLRLDRATDRALELRFGWLRWAVELWRKPR